MEPDDVFSPETVDEQMDQFLTDSSTASSSPNARVIHDLHAYYEEGQRATEHVWQQLARSLAEHGHNSSPADLPPEEPIPKDRFHPKKQTSPLSRRVELSRFALIAAVFVALLVVGSQLGILQRMQSTGGKQSPQDIGVAQATRQAAKAQQEVYFLKNDGIDKRDVQTGKILWHMAHQFQQRTQTPAEVIDGALYLLDDYTWNKIVALNTDNGKVLWSRTFDTVRTTESIRPILIDGLLYFSGSRTDTVSRAVLSGLDVVYALNPADGTIKATYKAPASGWHDLTIQNHVLYYTVDHPGSTTLYAAQFPGGKVLWQKPAPSPQATSTGGNDMGVVAKAGDRRYEAHGGNVYAFDVQTGKQVWVRPYDTFDLKATPATLYLSYTIHGTSHRGLVALSAKDGTTLWQRDIPHMSFFSGTFSIHLVNGILYDVAINGDNITVADPFLYAVRADNGTILWNIPLKNQDDIDSIIDIIG